MCFVFVNVPEWIEALAAVAIVVLTLLTLLVLRDYAADTKTIADGSQAFGTTSVQLSERKNGF